MHNYVLMGQRFHSQFETALTSLSDFHGFYSVSAWRGYDCPPTFFFFFLFFFQTFAERSCETCVTHRVEGVVQLIHYIDKALEMPSESRVS